MFVVKHLLCLLLMMLPMLSLASESLQRPKARLIQDTEVREKPQIRAAVLGSVDADTEIAVRDRVGGWYQIEAVPLAGWVQLLSVRFESSAYRPGRMGVSSLWKSVTKGHSDITVTTGVRGLGEKEIRQASINPEALRQLQTIAITPDTAREFARQAHLKPRSVDYEVSEND